MKLLLLHGLGQNKESWEQTINYLGYNSVECPNLIATSGQNQTFTSLMNNLESRYLNDDDSSIICGLSLGAILAIAFYLRNPQKVKAMILIAPQYKMPTHIIDIQNIIFRLMPKKVFLASGTTKENMISISKSMRRLDYSNRIKAIKCPTVIVCGEKDRANMKAAISMNDIILNSEITIVHDAGHEVNIDAPEKLAKIIHSVIKSTD